MLDARMNPSMDEAYFQMNASQRKVDDAFFAFDLNDAHVTGNEMPVDHLLHHFHLNVVQRHQNASVELYGMELNGIRSHQNGSRQSCLGVAGQAGNHDYDVEIHAGSGTESSLQKI